ncbi:MAG: hypothetical protein HRT46_12395, partial [Deltaproteobacteria bacterium]|nr:hypothetical protein [Deltaproteobacteria bacterium]
MLLIVAATTTAQHSSWRADPSWSNGKAEWAQYAATRVIYGEPRTYAAPIFTTPQHMDPATTTKSGNAGADGAIPVFKHNISEIVPTENYDYRFLTTCFLDRNTLDVYKLVISTQDDCGSTYKQFVIDDGRVNSTSHCYFPGAGTTDQSYRRPGEPRNFTFHDALTLRLRDYPFDADPKPEMKLKLVEDQTNIKDSKPRPEEATVRYVGRERITVPYGSIETHHLQVEHAPVGGASASDYWFAAEPDMRNVLVRYEGPFGVKYALKRLGWWAYWAEPQPQ